MDLANILEGVKLTGESISAVLDAIEGFLSFLEKRKRNGFRKKLTSLAETMQETNNQKLSLNSDMERYFNNSASAQRDVIWQQIKPQFSSVASSLSKVMDGCRGLSKAIGIEASSTLSADLTRQKRVYTELTNAAQPRTESEIEELKSIASELEQLVSRVIQNEAKLDKLIAAV